MQDMYFPKTGRGTILLTTRNFVIDKSMAVVDLNELKMDDETALRLLLRENLTDDPKALDIVRELGHLPLAIDLAGALMAEDKITPAKLLERYRKDVVSYLRLDDMLELTNSAYGKPSGLYGACHSIASRPKIPWQLISFAPLRSFIRIPYLSYFSFIILKMYLVLLILCRQGRWTSH